jgi:excisionase family DNA binding protein
MEPLLTTDQAAECLGVAGITLRKWRLYGGGPRFVRLGRAVRYRLGALEAYVAKQEFDSTSQADTAAAA